MNFDEIINRKGTHSIKWDAGFNKGIANDTLPMWVADMDFKTTDKVIETMVQRASEGISQLPDLQHPSRHHQRGW